jgi:rhodanese-related sulfurtransferase
LQPITRDELARRIRRGEVTVVDVRPAAEYEAGHVEGARSLPIGELRRRLDSLPRDGELVAYCRGPYCVFADDAVRLLRQQGFDARRLEDGFPEWKRAGLPVMVGVAPGGQES